MKQPSLTLIIVVLLVVSTLILPVDALAGGYVSGSERVIVINNYGVAKLTDTLSIMNNGTSPIDSIDLIYPKRYSSTLESVDVRGGRGELLKFEKMMNQSSLILRIHLDPPIQQGGTLKVNVGMVFLGLVTFDGSMYSVFIQPYPNTPLSIASCNLTVIFPKDAALRNWPNQTFTKTTIDEKPALTGRAKLLPPLSSQEVYVEFTNGAQELLSFESVRREIVVRPLGQLNSKETYKIINLGGDLNAVTLPLPKNSSPINAYDSAGPISDRVKVMSDSIQVSPRFGKLKTNTSFTFTLEYEMPLQESVKRISWSGEYRLMLRLVSTGDWVAKNYRVSIDLPKGVTVDKLSAEANSTSILPDGSYIFIYEYSKVLPGQEYPVMINYEYKPFMVAVYPVQWVLALEIIVAALSSAILLRKPSKIISPAAIGKIRRYIELQDDKRALRFELERRDEELSRGAITKHDYRRMRKSIDSRLSEINRSLTALKNELKGIDPRYVEMANRLERAESEVEALKASEARLTSRYRSGQLSREVYDSMLSDLRKRIGKAEETIESIIVMLREEAR
ncbi:MAG: hypothetical protein ACUVTM_03170 [Candidatus Bathyarchaeia archaeon]